MISREKVETFCAENDVEVQFINNHDNAIIGLSTCFSEYKVVYSYLKIIENLKQDMTLEEAIEFFEFNIENSYGGNNPPVIIRDDLDWGIMNETFMRYLKWYMSHAVLLISASRKFRALWFVHRII